MVPYQTEKEGGRGGVREDDGCPVSARTVGRVVWNRMRRNKFKHLRKFQIQLLEIHCEGSVMRFKVRAWACRSIWDINKAR